MSFEKAFGPRGRAKLTIDGAFTVDGFAFFGKETLLQRHNFMTEELQSLKDQLEKEKEISASRLKERIEYQQKLEKAENLIKALGSMNDDHLLVVREGEAIHILLKEAERVISAYLESRKGENSCGTCVGDISYKEPNQ